jgi:hypothetical protein
VGRGDCVHGIGLPSGVTSGSACAGGLAAEAEGSVGGKIPLYDASVNVAPEPARMMRNRNSHAITMFPRMPSAPGIGDQSSSNPSRNQRPANTNAVTADRYETRLIIGKIVSHGEAVPAGPSARE